MEKAVAGQEREQGLEVESTAADDQLRHSQRRPVCPEQVGVREDRQPVGLVPPELLVV